MRRTIIVLVLLLLSHPAIGQSPEPIKWNFYGKEHGREYPIPGGVRFVYQFRAANAAWFDLYADGHAELNIRACEFSPELWRDAFRIVDERALSMLDYVVYSMGPRLPISQMGEIPHDQEGVTSPKLFWEAGKCDVFVPRKWWGRFMEQAQEIIAGFCPAVAVED